MFFPRLFWYEWRRLVEIRLFRFLFISVSFITISSFILRKLQSFIGRNWILLDTAFLFPANIILRRITFLLLILTIIGLIDIIIIFILNKCINIYKLIVLALIQIQVYNFQFIHVFLHQRCKIFFIGTWVNGWILNKRFFYGIGTIWSGSCVIKVGKWIRLKIGHFIFFNFIGPPCLLVIKRFNKCVFFASVIRTIKLKNHLIWFIFILSLLLLLLLLIFLFRRVLLNICLLLLQIFIAVLLREKLILLIFFQIW